MTFVTEVLLLILIVLLILFVILIFLLILIVRGGAVSQLYRQSKIDDPLAFKDDLAPGVGWHQ